MARTEIHPFCILRTQCDTVFNALLDYGYNHMGSLLKTHVVQLWSYLVPQEVTRLDFDCI